MLSGFWRINLPEREQMRIYKVEESLDLWCKVRRKHSDHDKAYPGQLPDPIL